MKKHPYMLFSYEVEKIIPLFETNILIDLFGGSGNVSKMALNNNNFDEVIYCDHKKWTKLPNEIQKFICDYKDVMSISDDKTTIFADPFFYNVYNYDNKWNHEHEHIKFIESILETKFSKVIILNTIYFDKLLRKYFTNYNVMYFGKRNEIDNIYLYIIGKRYK